MNEPFEGYIEGLNSGIGIICGIMSGFIRSMYASDGSGIKFSPADFVINATIASAWKRSTAPRDEFLVFNCTDAESHKIEWKESMKLAYPYFLKYAPYEKLVWFPNASITSSYVWHMISLVLFQLLPAVFADLILVLSGRKRM